MSHNRHLISPKPGLSTPYQYAFNGMERQDELSGVGNNYNTLYRVYDSRLGRWFSTDPLEIDFAWQSPYIGLDDNPVVLSDPLGDSTLFFNTSGELIYTSHDELENSITVIDQKGMEGFNNIVQRIESGELEEGNMIQHMRDHGTSYAIDGFKSFYNENKDDWASDRQFLAVEHNTFLVMQDGMMRANYENNRGSIGSVDVRSNDLNAVAELHIHPNTGKAGYRPAPSNPDFISKFNNSTFDIVVDKDFIFFINAKGQIGFAVYSKDTFNRGKVNRPWTEL